MLDFHSMLAEKLNMTPEDAERWIVNLIRNARLDAKIDSQLVSNGNLACSHGHKEGCIQKLSAHCLCMLKTNILHTENPP